MKFLVLLFCIVGFTPLWAAQNAVVVTDGAMVYSKADFDSSVIGYLRAGQGVRISSKTFGAFYRVLFKQGVIGYISDVDVRTSDGKVSSDSNGYSEGRNKSFISKRYVGPAFGALHFSEVYNSAKVGTNLIFYGVKASFPIRFLSGPFVFDSELLYHSGVPSYYSSTTSRGESGQIFLIDAEVLYSLFESKKRGFWAYIGGGPVLSYTSFVVEVSGSKNSLTDAEFGGVITGGVALKMSSTALKLESKYYALKSSYFGIIAGLQFEF